ncbi:MAG: hypothetical protein V5A88_09030 [Candidatus Thermoplasmatota archaeon]
MKKPLLLAAVFVAFLLLISSSPPALASEDITLEVSVDASRWENNYAEIDIYAQHETLSDTGHVYIYETDQFYNPQQKLAEYHVYLGSDDEFDKTFRWDNLTSGEEYHIQVKVTSGGETATENRTFTMTVGGAAGALSEPDQFIMDNLWLPLIVGVAVVAVVIHFKGGSA